jgi:APA family basic amino acid/polyamine antiporter
MAAVGAMVGAAIFLLVGATFAVAGMWSLVSVVLAGILALFAGMAYAELASGRPDASGGAYAWVSSALPAPSGFLSGWLAWGGAMATSTLCALGLGFFLLELVKPSTDPLAGSPPEAAIIGVVVLAVVGLAHFARIHVSVRSLVRVNLVKVLLILALVAIGIASLPSSRPLPTTPFPGSVGLVLGAGIFFIAFQGFEVIAQLSDQAKNPERTVARGTFLAVGLALLVYLLFFVAVLGNAPSGFVGGWPTCADCPGASQGLLFAAIGSVFGQPYFRLAFLLVGIVSLFGALNASVTSAVRTCFSMARDGLLPSAFVRVGARQVPPAAILATAVGSAILLLPSLQTIAILAGLAFLGLFAFVEASVIALRRRERPDRLGFRMPLVPALPLFAIALDLATGAILWGFPAAAAPSLSMRSGYMATYIGATWLAVGLIYHYFAGGREVVRRTGVTSRADVAELLATSEEPVELERYRVFLPLREFEDTALVEFGAKVARARKGELSLLNVVEIPRNLPPKAIRFRYVDDRIRGLQKLAKISAQMGVDARPAVKIGYKVYEIILDTVKEEAVNLLVMGWRGPRLESERRLLGSNIDYLIENAPCDIVVFKTHGLSKPLKRIVVLSSPIWSVRGIGDLALILAEEDRPEVHIVSVVGDPSEADRLKEDAAPFLEKAHAQGIPVEQKILYSRAWESVAIQESAEASLLMIRATYPGGLRKFALGPVEDRIVKLANCPVLIYRKGGEVPGGSLTA